MKTLILTTALPLLATLAAAQETTPPPVKDTPAPGETIKKAAPAAWLGIIMSDVDGRVIVSRVMPDSPAAKAGLQDGDVLLSIGDRAVEGDVQRVAGYVAERKPGDAIELRVLRGEKDVSFTIKVELGARPDDFGDDFRGEFRRDPDSGKLPDKLGKAAEETKKKLKDQIEKHKDQFEKLDEKFKKGRDFLSEPERKELLKERFFKLDPKQFPDHPEFHLEKVPGKPGAEYHLYLRKDGPQEDAIWNRVEESVGRALKESGVGPDVIEKAMGAIKDARKNGPELRARRAKLENEAARIEKEMQALKEKAERLRDELKKTE